MRRKAIELDDNPERWLVSYADFITLLFGFFVVMYSISQVSESKYRVLSATLTEVFTQNNRTLEPIQVGELARENGETIFDVDDLNFNAEAIGAFDKTADMPQLSAQFEDQFADLIDDEVVQVNSNEYWLQLTFNNSILFPLGSVQPSEFANDALATAAELLVGFNNPIQVEGYTDNVPVSSAQFPSNWELSSARAAAVVKILVDEGVTPSRLAAVGYGQYNPIAENDTPEGRAQNRRIVIMIAREKIQRPRISTISQVQEAVEPEGREATTVNPQPGLSNNSETQEPLSPREKMDVLIENNQGLGLGSVLQLEPGEDAADNTEPENSELIQGIPTEGGGIIFSTDPNR